MGKKMLFSKKQRRLNRVLIMARNLEKRLSWVMDCEDGIERLVEFFQETTPLEEYYYGSVYYLFFWGQKKRQLINKLGKFALSVGRKPDQYDTWNRTKEEEVPSENSIFICVDDEQKEFYEVSNVCIHTMSVTKYMEKKSCPVEKYPGQWALELKALNEITLSFMRMNYILLKETLEDFQYDQ